jgi:hypothetical protein
MSEELEECVYQMLIEQRLIASRLERIAVALEAIEQTLGNISVELIK